MQWFGGTSGECTLGNHMTESTGTKSISSWCKRDGETASESADLTQVLMLTATTYWLDWDTYGGGTEHQPTMHKIGRKFVQCGQCTTVCTIETISCLENERFNFFVLCARKEPDVVQYSVICALCGHTNTVFNWHPNSLLTAPTLSTTFCV